MGNTKSTQHPTKIKIPTKYKCPIANRIMVNPKRIICSGNIYDQLSISKWIEANRYDPISGTPFTSHNGKLLMEDCTELKQEIEQFINDNDYYKEIRVTKHNVNWNNVFAEFDGKLQQKALYYEQLCQSLKTKGHMLLFPDIKDKNNVEWNKDLLLLLLTSNIPIITLVGASRQGKSTLINDILGLHDNPAFKTSNSPDIAQTKGAWIAFYNAPTADEMDEKEEKKDSTRIVYNQSFFIVDMEGLTNQVTKFTEKVFYSIYAFSDIIIWNDNTIGSDYFKNLMKKLQNTMSNIAQSSNKPSFLYLRRDKNNFFEFGEHKTLDKYINYSDGFKSFRELNLFSELCGYELVPRPSNKIPFVQSELKQLMNIILKLHKRDSRFITNYYELEKQLNYINEYGILSLGTQIVMEDKVLKWFLFDKDEKHNERKILLYAAKHGFSSNNIRTAFDEAINDPKFKNFEKVGIIDEDFKKQLVQNRDVMLHCIENKHDKLERIKEVAIGNVGLGACILIGGIPALAGGLVGGIIGGVADIAVKPFKKDHKMGTYTASCARGGAIVGGVLPAGVVLGLSAGATKAIETGVEASSKFKNKHYSRYQVPSSSGFSTKVKLIEADNLIPLFVNSQNGYQVCQDLHFDQQLLSLASSENSIILMIDTANSVESQIEHASDSIYMIRMSWSDDMYSTKMFYSLYCIANAVIWKGDAMIESKSFESFAKQLQTDTQIKKKCSNAQITCLNHHLLKKFEQSFDENTPVFYSCGECGVQIVQCTPKEKVYTLYGCRECNFDLCAGCYLLKDSTNRKPAFLYFCNGQATVNDEPECFDMTQNEFFQSFCELNMFSSISGYKIGDSTSNTKLSGIVMEVIENAPRFVKFPFKYVKNKIDHFKCRSCSKTIPNISVLTQCIHCGHLNFDQEHNNEYSFYRHLIYINKYNMLSFELQLILDHPILKHFLYDTNDEYADILMWNFAKKYTFNKREICKQFANSQPRTYCGFFKQLLKGKYIYIYALSSGKQEWITPSLSPLVINENKTAKGSSQNKTNQKNVVIDESNDEKRPLLDDKKDDTEQNSIIQTQNEQTSPLVDKLTNMGFEREAAISALQKTGDNFEHAVELLISNSNITPGSNVNHPKTLPTQMTQNSINKLTNMGFAKNEVIKALKQAENNFESALEILVQTIVEEKKEDENNHNNIQEDDLLSIEYDINKYDKENKNNLLSAEESTTHQFYNFLKRMKMEKYFDKFKQNDCCDMECITFFDDEGLENDIGIKSKMARKRFLKKCEETKEEMDKFKNEYGISSILYDRLAKYGIVTMHILCNEVKEVSDLKDKFEITNENQCNLLWTLVQHIENAQHNVVSIQVQKEGDGAKDIAYNTPHIK